MPTDRSTLHQELVVAILLYAGSVGILLGAGVIAWGLWAALRQTPA
jgi:hypothetical protein